MTDLFPAEDPAPSSDVLSYRAAPVYRREINDWYVEPTWAVDALIKAENFDQEGARVEDPACGRGTIPNAFAAHNYAVQGSDLVDRGWTPPPGDRSGSYFHLRDFLRQRRELAMPDHIVSNPPFKDGEAFARKALSEARRKVCMLLPLAFLESEKRLRLWRETPLVRVHVFASRVSMPPGHLTSAMKAEGGKTAFAWFVWDRAYGVGVRPELRWLEKP